jgi:membrane protein YqaA with SNARE-associated domain
VLHRLYSWVIRLSSHRHAYWYLALVAFAESSFFPIPPDPMILTMSLANRQNAFKIATVTTVASVLGGFLGYYIGLALFEALGVKIINLMSSPEKFETIKEQFHHWGFWIIALKGFTPVPFKLVTISCGVMKYDLWKFFLASVIARGSRFYFVSWLLWKYGASVRSFVEKNLTLVTAAAFGILVVGFFLLRWI